MLPFRDPLILHEIRYVTNTSQREMPWYGNGYRRVGPPKWMENFANWTAR